MLKTRSRSWAESFGFRLLCLVWKRKQELALLVPGRPDRDGRALSFRRRWRTGEQMVARREGLSRQKLLHAKPAAGFTLDLQ